MEDFESLTCKKIALLEWAARVRNGKNFVELRRAKIKTWEWAARGCHGPQVEEFLGMPGQNCFLRWAAMGYNCRNFEDITPLGKIAM